MLGLKLHFVGYATLLFLLLLLNHHTCKAQNSTGCASTCGNHNISYPFRLKTDPGYCGDVTYELTCENNLAVLYLYSVKYYVQAINYDNFTIRVVDADVQKDNCSFVPYHASEQYGYLFSYNDPFSSYASPGSITGSLYESVVFINCTTPVTSWLYIDTSSCDNSLYNSTSSSFQSKGYSYAILGSADVADLVDSCRVDNSFKTSFLREKVYGMIRGYYYDNFQYNISCADVCDSLSYGYELSWFRTCCQKTIENHCNLSDANIRYCNLDHQSTFLRFLRSFVADIHSFLGRLLGFLGVSSDNVPFVLGEPIHSEPWLPVWVSYLRPIVRHMFALLVFYRIILFFCGIPCVVTFLIYKWRWSHLSAYENIEEFLQNYESVMPIRYSYSNIKKITKGFKDKLGEGGYGSVYKGKLRSGRVVAVKILGKSKANGQEFINEVATIGRIHHANIVQLIGFCAEGSKRALIYEFMANGSLDKHIFSCDKSVPLSTQKIYEISIGVASGIEYLHRGCNMQILHFDIKPHNILLDENFNSKVSDFGLAKLYATNNSIVSLTAVRGTIGYMAPELFYRSIGGISYKADVYSFGMMLMEMAGRRKNLNTLVEKSSEIYFPSWIYDQFSQGKDIELEQATEIENKIIKKMIIVALWCIQLKPNDRPSMRKVVEMLEGEVESLELPPKPSYGPAEIPTEKAGSSTNATELTDPSSEYTEYSLNNCTDSINLVIDPK